MATTTQYFNWNGRYFKGAMRQHRELKRAEAERRNALTAPARRRANRIAA